MINDGWCNNNIQELKSFCSPKLAFLTIKCRPFYQPREFSSVIVTAVYIPPQADKTALKELHWTLCKQEIIYPEGAFIVDGDFNKANFRTKLPKFHHHINCTNTLDHCYYNFRDAYKALPCPPFDKSNHSNRMYQ
jgi:hypothetical protein